MTLVPMGQTRPEMSCPPGLGNFRGHLGGPDWEQGMLGDEDQVPRVPHDGEKNDDDQALEDTSNSSESGAQRHTKRHGEETG